MEMNEIIKKLKEVEKIEQENKELKEFLSSKILKVNEYLSEISKILKECQPNINTSFAEFSEGTLKSAFGSVKARNIAKSLYADLRANLDLCLCANDVQERYAKNENDDKIGGKAIILLRYEHKDIIVEKVGKTIYVRFNPDYRYNNTVIKETVKKDERAFGIIDDTTRITEKFEFMG